MFPKFVVITPAKNEGQYLPRTIASVVSQTTLPAEWVIVDDGSNDETADLAYAAARNHPWIQVVRRKETGARDIGYGDTAAFEAGLRKVRKTDYDFVFKIDADVVLGPRYFQGILEKFAANPKLGIASGDVVELIGDKLVKTRYLPLGFNGMTKSWRRTCFEEIGGIPRGLIWDAIDCYQAMMRGWQTLTFLDEELRVIHLRPIGSTVVSVNHYRIEHGRGLYFIGAHPLWMLGSAFYHLASPPYILAGLNILIGFLEAWLKGAKRYDDRELRAYVREWQRKRLAGLLKLR